MSESKPGQGDVQLQIWTETGKCLLTINNRKMPIEAGMEVLRIINDRIKAEAAAKGPPENST